MEKILGMKKLRQNRENQAGNHGEGTLFLQHTDDHCNPEPDKVSAKAKLWLSHIHAGPGGQPS